MGSGVPNQEERRLIETYATNAATQWVTYRTGESQADRAKRLSTYFGSELQQTKPVLAREQLEKSVTEFQSNVEVFENETWISPVLVDRIDHYYPVDVYITFRASWDSPYLTESVLVAEKPWRVYVPITWNSAGRMSISDPSQARIKEPSFGFKES